MKNKLNFAIVTVAIAAVVVGLSTIVLCDGIQTASAQAVYPPPGQPSTSQGQGDHKDHHLLFQDKVTPRTTICFSRKGDPQGPPSAFPGQGDPQGPPSAFPGQGDPQGPPSAFPGQGDPQGPPN